MVGCALALLATNACRGPALDGADCCALPVNGFRRRYSGSAKIPTAGDEIDYDGMAMRTRCSRVLRKLVERDLARRVLSREDLRAGGSFATVFEFGDSEIVEILESSLPAFAPPQLLEKCTRMTMPRPFVAELKDAELIGAAAIGHLPEHGFVLETAPGDFSVLQRSLRGRDAVFAGRLPSFVLGGTSDFECACCLVNVWSKNYFHWITEGLTRLEGLLHYEHVTGRKPVIIVDHNPPRYVLESLEIFGLADRAVPWPRQQARVRRLVVPSFRRQEGRISAAACRALRAKVQQSLGAPAGVGHRNVYISRRKAGRRRVLNESKVVDCLSQWKFEAVVLEDMTFREQVALFSQARCILAPHGAGLTNMLWADGASIIEVFGSTVVPCYFTLAHALGGKYSCINASAHGDDVEIDVQELARVVHGILA